MENNRTEKPCEVCGASLKTKPSHYDRRKTCSRSCADKLRTRNGTETRVCRNCGKQYTQPKSRAKYGRGSVCSKECQYQLNSRLFTDESVAIYADCLCCGQQFRKTESGIKGRVGAGKYCSRECRDKHRVKENHPQYLSGSASEKRGPNWQAQKRAAKQRDNDTCIDCGLTEADSIAATGESLHVHHKTPYRRFSSFVEANDLGNLITLCPPCHRRADAEIQRIERRAA